MASIRPDSDAAALGQYRLPAIAAARGRQLRGNLKIMLAILEQPVA